MNTQRNVLPTVESVSVSATHSFSKSTCKNIVLVAGIGIEGDAHAGVTVQHRSRVAANPEQPNLRQVHLIQAELLDELRAAGFEVEPGSIGENMTTRGIDLLNLPTGTKLYIGADAVIELTGLRNPCSQLDDFQDGLKAAVLDKDSEGNLIRKAGVMAIVLASGVVQIGDGIRVELPEPPYRSMERV